VRVLFDQGTPVPLRRFLPDHSVSTAYEQGWSSLKNGELLKSAEDNGFEVLVTTDTNLKYQQNLSTRRIAVVVLSTTSWPRINTASEKVVAAIGNSTPSSYVEVQIP
jgi:predicted nuclease of predicted toxin-antitoxin system